MKVLWTLNMQVLVLWNSFLSFLVSREYMFQASKLNRKYNFEDCATQVNSSEEKIWFT
jgi:hypothetical protein